MIGQNVQYNFAKRPQTSIKKVASGRAHGNSDATMKMNNSFAQKEKESTS